MGTLRDFDVRVIESTRRKKTVSGRIVGDTIEIRVPAGMGRSEKQSHIADLSAKLLRQRSAEEIDLTDRSDLLAQKYDLPRATAITWSARQNSRWGSCTPATGSIRISHRLSEYPAWVLDYIIVHELAHLSQPNHSPAFHELVARFPRAERAEGFLTAVSLGHAGSPFSVDEHQNCDDIGAATRGA